MAKTLAKKLRVSQKRLGRKIAEVHRDDPGLSNRAAAGKAKGILEHRRKKKRRRS